MEIKKDFYGRIGDKFIIINEIAKGGFGKIYLVKEKTLDKEYVAKTFSIDDKTFENEKIIYKFAKGNNIQNIIEFKDSGTDEVELEDEGKETRNYIILKYCDKGNLLKYVPIGGFDELFVKVIFYNILEIIDNIHYNKICHLDLKLQNILLDNNYNIIITDFGLSKQINDQNKGIFTQVQGTHSHMPPQMFLKKKIFKGVKYDIFSLGVILFHLLNANHCFEDASSYKYKILLKKEEKYIEEIELLFPPKCSDNFKKLFIKMVAYDENNRPSIRDIINDEWFNEIKVFSDEDRRDIIKEVLEKRNEEIEIIETYNKLENLIYEAFNEDPLFNEKTKIKCLKDNIKFDNYILINGNLDPIYFMNQFANEMEEKYDDIEQNEKNYLKFNIIIKKKENKKEDKKSYEMEKDLKIQVELFKKNNSLFLLNFIKSEGSLVDFYYYLKDIKEKAKKII